MTPDDPAADPAGDATDDSAAQRFVFYLDPRGQAQFVDLGHRAPEFQQLAAEEAAAAAAAAAARAVAAERSAAVVPVQPTRRGPVRTLAAMTAVAGIAATTLIAVGSGSAQAGPPVTKALQNVTLSLSPRGQLTAVKTSDVLDAGGTLTTRSETLDPAKAASAVPVVATLGYVHNGMAGTDLADLKGASGPVEIDVTLTNVSTRSVLLSTSQGKRYAQVTTPFTVVGAASLPTASYRKLVTSQTGKPSAATTNGLVSRDGDRTTVQWASLLAPPQLPGTATFRLVLDAKKLVLPDITLRVSPGLTADPSVASAFDTAFGTDSPVLQLEATTSALIDEVNDALNKVQSILGGVSTSLIDSAKQTGTEATQKLSDTGASAAGQLESVNAQLRTLDTDLKTELTNAQQAGLNGLASALATVTKQLGLPTSFTPEPVATTSAVTGDPLRCTSTPTTSLDPADTLWKQIQAVSGLLHDVSDVSAGCVEKARQALLASIGDSTKCDTPAQSKALACVLRRTTDAFTAERNGLAERASTLLTDLKNTPLGDVTTAITSAKTAVGKLQDDLQLLAIAGGGKGGLSGAIDTVAADVTALQALVDPASSTSFSAGLAELHTIAADARKALGDASDAATADTTRGALNDLAAKICDLAVGGDALHLLIDGTACKGNAPGAPVTTLADRLATDAAAWDDVLDATDPTTSVLGGDISTLTAGLTTLSGHVAAIKAVLGKPGKQQTTADTIGALIDTLVADGAALYQPSSKPACPQVATPGEPALNAIERTFEQVVCAKTDVANRLDQILSDTAKADAQDVKDLEGTVTAATGATGAANAQFDALFHSLSGQLTNASNVEQAATFTVLQAKVTELTKQVKEQQGNVVKVVNDSKGLLSGRIDSAITDNSGKKTELAAGIQRVLDVLGSSAKGGLLHRIYLDGTSVNSDGVLRVHSVADDATAFSNVRITDSEALRLQQLQYNAGFQQIRDLSFLGSGLPAGADHTVLYTFHLAGGE